MFMRILLLLLVGSALGGCATYPGVKQLVQAHRKKPVKLLVSEAPIGVDHARLQAVLAPDAKLAAQVIAQGVENAQAHTLSIMTAKLSAQPAFAVVTAPEYSEKELDQILGGDQALSQPDADRIRMETGADAILRFRITDYGLTPTSWRDGYIAFEVTSTIAIAGVIAYSGSAAAHVAAGGYLAQETVEEATEAYAGFWGLDVVCRPVRIEAELIRLRPVAKIWETGETGLSDVRLSRLTRKVGASERNAQLDKATDHAVNDVMSALSKAVAVAE